MGKNLPLSDIVPTSMHPCQYDESLTPYAQLGQTGQKGALQYLNNCIQSTLVISTSVISNNRLSRRENPILVLI